MVELDPSGYSYSTLATAEFEARSPRAAYAAVLRAIAAARRERSFELLFVASQRAGQCVQHGALGSSWRMSQVVPCLDNADEAMSHRRWLPPASINAVLSFILPENST